ncbi:FtsX-like permease family [uncultured Clostridium sp.]|uniref:ABC transporter permease n=1 Tax=Muricoprocola aceti TaxID=2981772 RepID=A0ABT2SKM8_9FIRM|nr:ABC transporter permease [Muricoprocola aceti]MCU6725054.1 ABC transporter permease [Muricoprocola aceti]SCH36755.1 FtsX-like permease family [uncultured Clostridium sp.]
MKNPLHKRLPREIRSEFGKYIVIFLLMVATIGFVSGFLVADNSMLLAYQDGFEKYNIEDGNFRTADRIYRSQREDIEKLGITLYENYYIEATLDNESTMRFFKNREEINKVCLMKGELPKAAGEVAIDRMYADNNQLAVGDTITGGERSWKITGLVALSDYSCLFQNNSDSMFDAVKFGVGVVTPEEFDTLNQDKLQYNYSWKYEQEPADEVEEKEISEDLMEETGKIVSLESFVPRYTNQAITFTGEDMGGDKAMMIMLLYIIMVIMAFVFGITISNTIRKEAAVIGILRASGYTRRELISHYMTLPVLVTLAGALAGNVLGYTVLKNVCAAMYYGSYSLPTYETVWNAEAFLLTTVVPVLIMLVVNFCVLRQKLRLSPLKFLRRDLSGKKQKRAMRLSPHIKIFSRFRLRVIFQNMSNYLVLLIGILFANLLLMFGLLLPSTLAHYQTEIQENMLANYQYMLQVPMGAMTGSKLEELLNLLTFYAEVRTDNETAEKFSAYALNTLPGKYKSEEVLLYGVEKDSKYVTADLGDGVYISSAYADKFRIRPGDTITLKEKYEKDEYSFTVDGIYDYTAGLCIFMSRDKLNETFDLEDDYYSGYFSDTPITDIRKKYIGSVVDLDALTKISRQLDVSMGSMMEMVNGFAIMIYIVLIYLLSKIIIEKNAQSISMVKILGYTNWEISRLYILSTTIVVVICLLVSFPAERAVMEVLFREMMLSSISGWITMWVNPMIYVQMFGAGMVAYAVVALLEFCKIKKVPMDEALKNVE